MRVVKKGDVVGKIVLVRVDFNVPLVDEKIVDDARIKAALPTIEFLTKHAKKVVLMSHLGRPKGEVKDSLRMDPVAKRLTRLIKQSVKKFDECLVSRKEVEQVNERIILLENVRFHPEEKKNDKQFAKKLAAIADVYVNDAFGAAHRAHASVSAAAKQLPAFGGFLIEREVKELSKLLDNPKRPFVAIMGGAKVADKIGVMRALLKKVDAILVGGAMMFTFLKALGCEVGKSVVDEESLPLARKLLKQAKGRIWLPIDVVAARSKEAETKVCDAMAMPKSLIGLDLGPETTRIYEEALREAKTVFWNGPLGYVEQKPFDKATRQIAKTLASAKAKVVIGGGDTVAALGHIKGEFDFVSSGGGAALEFLEGKELPGLAVLKEV